MLRAVYTFDTRAPYSHRSLQRPFSTWRTMSMESSLVVSREQTIAHLQAERERFATSMTAILDSLDAHSGYMFSQNIHGHP